MDDVQMLMQQLFCSRMAKGLRNHFLKLLNLFMMKEYLRVIVVAIGKGIDVDELKSMTKHDGVSDTTHDHFFHENDIEKLTSDAFIHNSIEGCNFAAGKT